MASNFSMGSSGFSFIDILDSLKLLTKKLRGHNVTKVERRKMRRTATDVVTLVPITILLLIPISPMLVHLVSWKLVHIIFNVVVHQVSAVGHASMLAAIRKYIPSPIPSPYSADRLDLVKQLKLTKKMEVQRIASEDSDC